VVFSLPPNSSQDYTLSCDGDTNSSGLGKVLDKRLAAHRWLFWAQIGEELQAMSFVNRWPPDYSVSDVIADFEWKGWELPIGELPTREWVQPY
jgi:hypothetical protein